MQDIRGMLTGKKLIHKTDKYELYFDEKEHEVLMYSIEFDDIWSIDVNDLGNMGFEHYLK